MILEYSVSNYKSIKNKVMFSAVAGKDTTFLERTREFQQNNILKTAILYGANGSGKSNLIQSIAFMKNLVVNSINYQPGQGILYQPHKQLGFEQNSEFSIQFIIDDIRYAYGFSLNNMVVVDEYLYYFPKKRQAKIFERIENEVLSFGDKFKGKFTNSLDVLKPNRLFLSCAANFSSVNEIANVYGFFRDKIVIYSLENQQNWMNYSLGEINNNPKTKEIVLSFLDNLGLKIKDVKVNIEQQDFDPEAIALPDFLSDDFKEQIKHSKVNSITAKLIYNSGMEVDLIHEESAGIKKLFSFLCPFIDIIKKEKTLICDELEASLHEAIIAELISLFTDLNSNNNAQLFFSTHDTSLLNLDLFRRDQIWFTELKENDRSTDLYSLAEIKNIRKDEKYGKGYISGKYGAIPFLNHDMKKIIDKE